jgi:hypothetical protein
MNYESVVVLGVPRNRTTLPTGSRNA